MRSSFRLTAIALLGLLLAACQPDTSEVADSKTLESDDPAEVTERIAADLKADNLLGALQAAVPPVVFDELKSDYEKSRAEKPSEADRAEFADNMAKLTADNAEATLLAELEPMLVKYETEMAAQLPMFVAMGNGYAQQWLQEDKTMSADQKQQVTQMLNGVVTWLGSVNFADRKLAGQAIGRLVAGARALELKTIDDAQALTFEQAAGKASIISATVKDVLALYGLKINDALGSVQASVISEEADAARISVEYTFFDQPLKVETDMVRQEGRWYGKDTLAKIARDRAADAAAPPAIADDAEEFPEQDDAEAVGEGEVAADGEAVADDEAVEAPAKAD
ncbi:MAG: hypothetical protein ACT4NL_18140 [Pseudomarimonas sp.]